MPCDSAKISYIDLKTPSLQNKRQINNLNSQMKRENLECVAFYGELHYCFCSSVQGSRAIAFPSKARTFPCFFQQVVANSTLPKSSRTQPICIFEWLISYELKYHKKYSEFIVLSHKMPIQHHLQIYSTTFRVEPVVNSKRYKITHITCSYD